MVGVYQCEGKASKHSTLNIHTSLLGHILGPRKKHKEIMNFILNLTVNREK